MKKTKRAKQYIGQNPIEQIVGIGSGAVQSLADTGKKFNVDNLDEILGFVDSKEKQQKKTGDLREGQELNLKELHRNPSAGGEETKEKVHIEPGIDYSREIIHAGEQAITYENREIETQLRELMSEIKKLADSSKELQAQFKEVAVEQHTEKPGKYHKTFFEWLLSVVKSARMKVEDSGAWLSAMQSKKKQREYGAMSKKHGTTFSLSNERVVATQVG